MLVDQEAMRNLAMFGCVKGMDSMALHMLKKSGHPLLEFRRNWMRRVAIQQYVDSIKNQKRLIENRKRMEFKKLPTMHNAATFDANLFNTMRHHNKEPFSLFEKQVRKEAPKIFTT